MIPRLLKDSWRSNCLRFALVLILATFMTIGCSSSDDDDDPPPPPPDQSTGIAGGTYTYDAGAETLTVDIGVSSFLSACGPQVEVSEFPVLELTATTIRLQFDSEGDIMTWTRTTGSADSVVGTWNYSEGSITDATITINADGTFSITGTFECGDDDDGTLTTYYRDSDGDGYGDPSMSVEDDSQPSGFVSDNTDCNDADGDIHPGATEVCGDDVDNNCDGTVDEGCNLNELVFSGEWNETDGDEGTFTMTFTQTETTFTGTYDVIKETNEGGSYSYTISGNRGGNNYVGTDSRGRIFHFEIDNTTLSGNYYDPDGGETGYFN